MMHGQKVIERLQYFMLSIKPLPEFTRWMDALPDANVRGVMLARIKRLSLGLMGYVAPVGDGSLNCESMWVRDGGCTLFNVAKR